MITITINLRLKFYALLVIFLISRVTLLAQTLSDTLLRRSIDAVQSFKTLRYEMNYVEVNPFSTDNDTIKGTVAQTIKYGEGRSISSLIKHYNLSDGVDIWDKGVHFYLNRIDSTYTQEKQGNKHVKDDLTDLIDFIEQKMLKNPSKVTEVGDTLINSLPCRQYLYKQYDSLENNEHNYTYKYLSFNKKTALPVLYKEVGEGNASKGGMSMGRIHMYVEHLFNNYQPNIVLPANQFVADTAGFTLPNKALLATGATIPTFEVKDLNGKTISPLDVKGKLLLFVFGAVDCPANPLSNPMLNRIYERYQGKNIAILNIYSDDAKRVSNYQKKNGLQFPLYLGNRKLKSAFQTLGTPDFYLVDDQGKVLMGQHGFNKKLESDLIYRIDAQL